MSGFSGPVQPHHTHACLTLCIDDPGAVPLQVAEQTTQYFITNDRPNVAGLVLAGSADFKTELGQSDMFDQRLKAIILLTVDVSYGAAPPWAPHTAALPPAAADSILHDAKLQLDWK